MYRVNCHVLLPGSISEFCRANFISHFLYCVDNGAYFLKNSGCVYHTLLYICLLPYFILVYIIYFLNIDVSICMDVRRIECWSPVVTSPAYLFTVYMSCTIIL